MEDFINQSLLSTPDKWGYIYFKLQPIFTHFLIAVIVLLIGLIIGKIVGRVVDKLLQEIEINELIKKIIQVDLPLDDFLGKAVQYVIFFLAIAFALDILGLTAIIAQVLSAMILLIIIGSFLVSSKDFLPNLFAGIKIYRKKIIKIHDHIKVGTTEGEVIDINLFEIVLKTKQEDIIYIPNSFIFKNILSNHFKH